MLKSPFFRKLALMAHIVTSIGWVGAVVVYLVLSMAAWRSINAETVRGAYVAMQLAVWYVIVPASFASLLTGLLVSLNGPWGVFQHYWVIFKLCLNLFAVTILLLYTRSLDSFVEVATHDHWRDNLDALRNPTHLVHTVGALVVLLTATTLSVYKPRGVTAYGRKMRRQ